MAAEVYTTRVVHGLSYNRGSSGHHNLDRLHDRVYFFPATHAIRLSLGYMLGFHWKRPRPRGDTCAAYGSANSTSKYKEPVRVDQDLTAISGR